MLTALFCKSMIYSLSTYLPTQLTKLVLLSISGCGKKFSSIKLCNQVKTLRQTNNSTREILKEFRPDGFSIIPKVGQPKADLINTFCFWTAFLLFGVQISSRGLCFSGKQHYCKTVLQINQLQPLDRLYFYDNTFIDFLSLEFAGGATPAERRVQGKLFKRAFDDDALKGDRGRKK